LFDLVYNYALELVFVTKVAMFQREKMKADNALEFDCQLQVVTS